MRCGWCEKEMLDKKIRTCVSNLIVTYPDGKEIPSTFYEGEGRCPECNVVSGSVHHPGCNREKCPRCGGQIISCECLDEEDE